MPVCPKAIAFTLDNGGTRFAQPDLNRPDRSRAAVICRQ